jgi:hypothetical protein
MNRPAPYPAQSIYPLLCLGEPRVRSCASGGAKERRLTHQGTLIQDRECGLAEVHKMSSAVLGSVCRDRPPPGNIKLIRGSSRHLLLVLAREKQEAEHKARSRLRKSWRPYRILHRDPPADSTSIAARQDGRNSTTNINLRRPAHPVNDAAGTSELTVELGLFTGAHSRGPFASLLVAF